MTDLGTGLITAPLFFVTNFAKAMDDKRLFCTVYPGLQITVDSDSHKCEALHCPARPSGVQRSSHDEACLCCHCGDVACWHQCDWIWSCFVPPSNRGRIGDPRPSVPGGYRLLLHQNPPGRPSAQGSHQCPDTGTDWTATRREFVRHEGVQKVLRGYAHNLLRLPHTFYPISCTRFSRVFMLRYSYSMKLLFS